MLAIHRRHFLVPYGRWPQRGLRFTGPGATSGTNATSYSFTNQPFGPLIPSATGNGTRWIGAVIMGCANSTPGDITACSLGGVAGTIVASRGSSNRPIAICLLQSNTTLTGTIAPTFAQTQTHCGVVPFQLTAPESATPSDIQGGSASQQVDTTLLVPNGGVGLVVLSSNFSANNAMLWGDLRIVASLAGDSSAVMMVGQVPFCGNHNLTGRVSAVSNIDVLAVAWNIMAGLTA